MAAGAVTAAQNWSFFVRNYYRTLQTHPETIHQLYNNTSSMIRIDGDTDTVVTAYTIQEISTVMTSVNFVSAEIKKVKSLRSMDDGVTILVWGNVRMRDYNGRRKFTQTFFLAPQENGYFVLSDRFYLLEEETAPQLGNRAQCVLELSNSEPETLASDSALEEEVIDYVQSVELGGDLGSHYGFEEQQSVVCKSPAVHEGEQPGTLGKKEYFQHDVTDDAHEREPQKKTFASVLRFGKGQTAASASGQPVVDQRAPLPSKPHPFTSKEQSRDISCKEDDSKLKSVFVGNLPFTITGARLEQELKKFGAIKPDSIVIKRQPNAAVCYAFIQFETMAAVHAAIQGSPIELDGKQAYVRKYREKPSGASQGGRSGRGGYSSNGKRAGLSGGRESSRGNNKGNHPRG